MGSKCMEYVVTIWTSITSFTEKQVDTAGEETPVSAATKDLVAIVRQKVIGFLRIVNGNPKQTRSLSTFFVDESRWAAIVTRIDILKFLQFSQFASRLSSQIESPPKKMSKINLTLAYLLKASPTSQQPLAEQNPSSQFPTLHPDISSLDHRRRLRRSPNVIQTFSRPTPERVSAYKSLSRGQNPYCSSRPPTRSNRRYLQISPATPCDCGQSSHRIPNPRDWKCSPAEVAEWDYERPNGGHPVRKPKVSFVEPMVTEVREVERWSKECWGPICERIPSPDCAGEFDDDKEIRALDATRARDASDNGKEEKEEGSRGRKGSGVAEGDRKRSQKLRKKSLGRGEKD